MLPVASGLEAAAAGTLMAGNAIDNHGAFLNTQIRVRAGFVDTLIPVIQIVGCKRAPSRGVLDESAFLMAATATISKSVR